MTNLEMAYKTVTIGLNIYFQSPPDRMLQAALQHKKTKQVVKKAENSSFSLIWLKKTLTSILNQQSQKMLVEKT